ncbi:hypothetical protein [Enterobacter sp. Ap-1006]|uniref:hypothetical protein n=1 Tax=Enterobacter sp. Ap-1006 TaxID=2608345 RepID=UPI001421CD5C|nr:hypothetical protein [Enterobacter sp. Ap-1006]
MKVQLLAGSLMAEGRGAAKFDGMMTSFAVYKTSRWHYHPLHGLMTCINHNILL